MVRRVFQLPYLVLIGLVLCGAWLTLRDERLGLSLDDIRSSNRFVVVTRNAPTTFYRGREGEASGFEADLARGFAKRLGVEVEFIAFDEVSDILDTVQSGRAHIAAAGLTKTVEREAEYQFSPPYRQVSQLVVCREGGASPGKPADLLGLDLVVTAASSHSEALRNVATTVEGLTWREDPRGPEALMLAVWEGDIACTIADEPIFQIARHHHPELVEAFDLTEPEPIAWIIAPGADELAAEVASWLADPKTKQGVERLLAAHFGFFHNFDYVDLAAFHSDIEKVLPEFENSFRTAARRNELPWRLLAAMAYQESRWEPDAKSRTGVRGLMMLTEQTAQAVGVEDRTDAEGSIWGGARYFADLLARVPGGVTGEDRYWFALAAYNMGIGHVYDARALAQRKGLNKDRWVDVKSVLRLLSDQQHYATLHYGRARGGEARRYVEQVRAYWHVLNDAR